MPRRGLLIILSSPSGAGKSTLAKRLLAWDADIEFSVSATTRAPRAGEVEGKDYYFQSREQFETMIAQDGLLEYAEVFGVSGNFYGSPKAPVENAIAAGRDVLFDIDWQGGQQLRNSALEKNILSIFLLPPSIEELENRLRNRGQDDAATIERRMAKSRDEISHWAEYDHVLVNDNLDATEAQLKIIVSAARLRMAQQPGLVETVRALNAEFETRK